MTDLGETASEAQFFAPPEAPAPGPTCPRCGNFAPLEELGDGRVLCAECVERTVHPIQQSLPTIGNVLEGTWQLLLSAGPQAALVVFLCELPRALLLWFVPNQLLQSGLGVVIQAFTTGVIFALTQQVLAREPLALGVAAGRAFERYGSMVAVTFLVGLVTGLGTLLCIIPGVMASVGLVIAAPLVALEGSGATEALGASWRRMDGHKGDAFVVALVLAIPTVLVMGLSFAALFSVIPTLHDMESRRAAQELFACVIAVVTPLATLPAQFSAAVWWAKLPRTLV